MGTDTGDAEKRLRNIKKKLTQIEKLKAKGGALDADAKEKVASEASLLAEVAALEAEISGAGAGAEEQKEAEEEGEGDMPEAAATDGATLSVEQTLPQEDNAAADTAEFEKRVRTLRKKLQQIEKLREKGGALDADAREKVASEPALLQEVADMERRLGGGGPACAAKTAAPASAKKPEAAPAPEVKVPVRSAKEEEEARQLEEARAKALEAPPSMLILLGTEVENRFRNIQKKLREAGKLREKDKLDNLQAEKLKKANKEEPALLEELAAIRAKAADAHQLNQEAGKVEKRAQKELGLTDEEAAEAAAIEARSAAKQAQAEEAQAEEGEAVEQSVRKKAPDSQDLKTARQKKGAAQALGAKKAASDNGVVTLACASWPEVREVLESGDCGVDKSRQKKAIEVNRPKPGPPYDSFDPLLLKCNFLTRIELRLPPGVIAHDDFQSQFPGSLRDSLLELILKANQMPNIPAGIRDLQRIRSVDFSHNMITELPEAETWVSIAGSLELLDLSFNQLSSISVLHPLRKLSTLKVDGNKLTSLEGVTWAELKQLSMLTAVGNAIAEIPSGIAECAGCLETVDLSQNKITALPAGICELKKLKSFAVGENPIKDPKAAKNAERGIKDLKAYLSKAGGKSK